ncbi:endoribonuclease L-PSP [Kosmotoga arenicorallina S304]|uniref:Endoribonuclease L-PSP n=1 Tax=Kosmotoga arenicorallina S304 TaxID=1453497 RepID=A0A176JXK0_9BACT|nr:Rid family detoxifying hydrolase [Kosmotoga arenicorallina]OAA28455.1 endoribonuclease L-PSP [Kosmotoga arenicorallina S304]
MLRVISTEKAPKAIGPYSQGILAGNMLFVSGQLPLNPDTGELLNEPKKAFDMALRNFIAVVQAAGGSTEDIAKVNVYIKDMDLFGAFNEVYSRYFTEHKPARAVVEVNRLPKNAIVEVEGVAYIKNEV